MKMKQWLVVVFGCLALAGAPLMGCGEDSDPSDSNNSTNNNDNNNNNQPDGGQEDSGPEPDADGQEDGGTDPDTGQDTGPDLDPSNCDPNLNFTGQAYDQSGDDHAGGQPTAAGDVTLADANLQAVWEAIPGEEDDPATVDIDVTEAVVIATVDGHGRLYVQDANAVLLLWYPWDGNEPTDPVKVGDTVSFKATEVQNFGGTPQVSAITDFNVVSSDAQVPYHALTGEDLPADSWGELVQVGGFVMSVERQDCGGDSVCYELVHGDNFTKSTTLRSSSSFLELGNCVTYFGPLSSFPGPKNDAGQTPDPQLDQINYDWLFSLQ